jgi:flagella basal body P-ring formation protein FlgA
MMVTKTLMGAFMATLAAGLVLASCPALAGQRVALRSELQSDGGKVTFGDLFEDAAGAGDVTVATRTSPETTLFLDASAVQRLAWQYGLDWDNPSGLRRLIVRPSADATRLPAHHAPAPSLRAAATASSSMVEALTYGRSIAAGDKITAEDLIYSPVLAQAVPSDALANPDDAIGLIAKRPLRTGQAVSRRDLIAAMVILKDDLVQIVYRDEGITINLQAKAIGPAALGQTFSALNISSKKTIEAVAIGPGQAAIGPGFENVRGQYRDLNSARRLAAAP